MISHEIKYTFNYKVDLLSLYTDTSYGYYEEILYLFAFYLSGDNL